MKRTPRNRIRGDGPVIEARDFLATRRNEAPRLGEVADAVGLSRFYLHRRFCILFGETPHGFLTRLKVEDACAMLARTNVAVTDLCLDLGYESLGSFSSWFKSHVGISPAGYRRAVRTMIVVPAKPERVWVPQCFAGMLTGAIPMARSEKR